MSDLTYAQVSQLLKYEPETGKLFWLPRPVEMFPSEPLRKTWSTRYSGKETFTAIDSNGYRVGSIFGRMYKAHRVVWLVHKGSWPAGEIDHINGDRADNRIVNLRDVSPSENHRNQRRRSDNSSGFCGVRWHKRDQKWMAQIKVYGKWSHLGYFENFEDAVAARLAANTKYGFTERHGEFATLRLQTTQKNAP